MLADDDDDAGTSIACARPTSSLGELATRLLLLEWHKRMGC